MIKRKEQRLLNKYEREDNLLYPLHKTDFDDPVRKKFLEDLGNNEHFNEACKAIDKQYAKSSGVKLKQLCVKDYGVILLFGGMFAGLYYGAYNNQLFHHDNITQKSKLVAVNTFDALSITAVLIIGLLMGCAAVISIKDADKELTVDKFYRRMSVRLFDMFKDLYPDLKQETLERCNPEMAGVITTLLMTNMPKAQTEKLQKIAMDLAGHKYVTIDKSRIGDLKARDKLINSAVSIVESYLLNNPELRDVILNVYKGQIPKTFVLNMDNQKTK